MFSKDFEICKIPEKRTVTPLLYKKFLYYSHCMVGIARNRKFFVESYKAAPLKGLRDVKNIYQILNFIELLCLEREKT